MVPVLVPAVTPGPGRVTGSFTPDATPPRMLLSGGAWPKTPPNPKTPRMPSRTIRDRTGPSSGPYGAENTPPVKTPPPPPSESGKMGNAFLL